MGRGSSYIGFFLGDSAAPQGSVALGTVGFLAKASLILDVFLASGAGLSDVSGQSHFNKQTVLLSSFHQVRGGASDTRQQLTVGLNCRSSRGCFSAVDMTTVTVVVTLPDRAIASLGLYR